MRIHEIGTLDEHQRDSFDHMKAYQKRMSFVYNKKVHPREFQVGEVVLRENLKNQENQEHKDKYEPNWLGPYIIAATFGSGTYQLSTLEGEQFTELINILHLSNFYAQGSYGSALCTYPMILKKIKNNSYMMLIFFFKIIRYPEKMIILVKTYQQEL